MEGESGARQGLWPSLPGRGRGVKLLKQKKNEQKQNNRKEITNKPKQIKISKNKRKSTETRIAKLQ